MTRKHGKSGLRHTIVWQGCSKKGRLITGITALLLASGVTQQPVSSRTAAEARLGIGPPNHRYRRRSPLGDLHAPLGISSPGYMESCRNRGNTGSSLKTPFHSLCKSLSLINIPL